MQFQVNIITKIDSLILLLHVYTLNGRIFSSFLYVEEPRALRAPRQNQDLE